MDEEIMYTGNIEDPFMHIHDDDDDTIDVDEEKYAQSMEINITDMWPVLKALMSAGYECLVSQDGESTDIVVIQYLHREYTGHWFEETAF